MVSGRRGVNLQIRRDPKNRFSSVRAAILGLRVALPARASVFEIGLNGGQGFLYTHTCTKVCLGPCSPPLSGAVSRVCGGVRFKVHSQAHCAHLEPWRLTARLPQPFLLPLCVSLGFPILKSRGSGLGSQRSINEKKKNEPRVAVRSGQSSVSGPAKRAQRMG